MVALGRQAEHQPPAPVTFRRAVIDHQLARAAIGMAQDVKTDYDHHVNFSQYHTYYWERVKTTNPLWENRIKDAVDHELQAKGWQRVDSGGDVAITAVGSAHDQREYQTFYDGLGGWRWGAGPRSR